MQAFLAYGTYLFSSNENRYKNCCFDEIGAEIQRKITEMMILEALFLTIIVR